MHKLLIDLGKARVGSVSNLLLYQKSKECAKIICALASLDFVIVMQVCEIEKCVSVSQ